MNLFLLTFLSGFFVLQAQCQEECFKEIGYKVDPNILDCEKEQHQFNNKKSALQNMISSTSLVCYKPLVCPNQIHKVLALISYNAVQSQGSLISVDIFEKRFEDGDISTKILKLELQIWVLESYYSKFNHIYLMIYMGDELQQLKQQKFELNHLIEQESCELKKWVKMSFIGAIELSSSNLFIRLFQERLNLHQENQRQEPIDLQSLILIKEFSIKSFNSFDSLLSNCKFTHNLSRSECVSNNHKYLSILKECISIKEFCQTGFLINVERNQCIQSCGLNEYEYYSEEIDQMICIQAYNTCSQTRLPGCKLCDLSNSICFSCLQGNLMKNNQCTQQNTHHQIQNFPQKYSQVIRKLTGCPNVGVLNCNTYDTVNRSCISCCTGYSNIGEYCQACPSGMKWDINAQGCSFFHLIKSSVPNGCLNESTNYCQQCFPTYTLSNNTKDCNKSCSDSSKIKENGFCQRCSNFISNCDKCASTSICYDCSGSKMLFPYQTANTSTTPIVSCVTSCPTGFFKANDNICQPCGRKCNTCSKSGSTTVCQVCRIGYVKASDGTNCVKDTSICGTGCVCSDPIYNYCDSCIAGYYFKAEECLPCISNCDVCSDSNTCSVCETGYELIGNNFCRILCLFETYVDNSTNTCLPCMPNCDSCSTPYLCNMCALGYTYDLTYNDCVPIVCPTGTFQDGNTCKACPPYCQICSNDITCTQCYTGYPDNGAGVCTQPSKNTSCSDGYCVACSSFNVCSACTSGKFLSSPNPDNWCNGCNQNCIMCNDFTTCLECQVGFQNVGGSCKQVCLYGEYETGSCEPCYQSNCLSCTQSGCTQCQIGYQLSSGTCNKLDCPYGYYQSSSQCKQCSYGCKSCSSQLPQICQTCLPYFYKKLGGCQKCMDNCISCTDGTSCTQCIRGFIFSGNQCVSQCASGEYYTTGGCQSCGITGCDICQSAGVCTKCLSNYVITASRNCDIRLICASNEYYVQSTNSCKNCSTNCQTCTNITNCTLCNSGFTVVNGYCQPTPTCNSAQFYNTTTNTCEDCSDFCLTCTSLTNCTLCDQNQDYFLSSSGSCTNVPPCTSIQYYNTQSHSCVDCKNNCLECKSDTICTKCETTKGFVLINSQCILVATCGDGNMNLSIAVNGILLKKTCDDRNTSSGDGCSSTCQLEKGFECNYNSSISKSICTVIKQKNYFSLKSKLNSDGNPQVTVVFSDDIKLYKNLSSTSNYTDSDLLDLVQKEMIVQIEGLTSSDYTYQATINSDRSSILLTFTMNTNIKNKNIQVDFNDDSFEIVNNLSSNTSSGPFPDYVVISQSAKEQAQTAAAAGSVVSQSIVASIVPIILFANFSMLFNALDLFQMILYLQYTNIRLPFNVISFIEIMTSFQLPFSINIFSYIIEANPIQEANLPAGFERQGAESIFLLNTGDSISQLLVLAIIHIILKIIVALTNKKQQGCLQKTNKYLKHKLHTSWEWGWYLDMYWEMFLSLIVGGLLQFFRVEIIDGISGFNSFAAIVIFKFAVLSPFVFWIVIYRNKNHLEEEDMEHKWGMLYESLQIHNVQQITPCLPTDIILPMAKKQTQVSGGDVSPINLNYIRSSTDESENKQSIQFNQQRFSELQINPINVQIASKKSKLAVDYFNFKQVPVMIRIAKYYFIILYLRKLIFGFLIVLLHDFTIVQLIMIDLLNIALIAILLRSKPYQSKYENYKAAICETFMLISQFSLKFLISDSDSQPESERINIGWIFIICVVGILAIQFIYIFATIIPLLLNVIREARQRCLKRSKVASLPSNIPEDSCKKDDGEQSVLSYQQKKPVITQELTSQIIKSESNDITEQNMMATPQINCTEREGSPVSPVRDFKETSQIINTSNMFNNSLAPIQEVSFFDNSNNFDANDKDNQIISNNFQEQNNTQLEVQNTSYITFRAQ